MVQAIGGLLLMMSIGQGRSSDRSIKVVTLYPASARPRETLGARFSLFAAWLLVTLAFSSLFFFVGQVDVVESACLLHQPKQSFAKLALLLVFLSTLKF